MWRIIWFLQGYVRAKIKGASPEWALERLTQARAAFLEPKREDDVTISVLLLKKDVLKAQTAAQRAMCELEIAEEYGLSKSLGGLFHRRAFCIAIALAMAASFVIPKFVFFYEVTGNEAVPEEMILRAMKSLGVGFGTYGPDIKPQELKNKMLLLIPELQWFTVQQSGMRARVVVRERPERIPVEERRAPMDVVAAKDGVITSVYAFDGNCLCQPGQAVKKGQLLISAYTDLEFTTRVCAARGEIYAGTLAQKTVVTPDAVTVKRPNGKKARSVSLLIGEKRWNIFANGGNLTGRCDKITRTHMLTLPGGLEIPIGLSITDAVFYDTVTEPLAPETAKAQMRTQAETAVRQDMIAGTILDVADELSQQNGIYEYTASIRCEEMIARMVRTSILQQEIKEETIP